MRTRQNKLKKTQPDKNSGSVPKTITKKVPSDSLHFGHLARHLIKTMPLGVVSFDQNLDINDINDSASRMLAEADNLADALDKGVTTNYEKNWPEILQHALAERNTSTFENISYARNGQNSILHIICTPLLDDSTNEVIGGILLIEDVTDKVMMENDLAMAERLAALGKLAARVAHELNNPLDGILRYINLALRLTDSQGNDNTVRYLKESRKGLQRMVRIISELLEFSRSTYSAFEEADINKIVIDAIKAMESQAMQNNVQVERHFQPEMPNIRSGNLFQVFCNLIKNAVDAMPQGGTLTITTKCDTGHLNIDFADTGSGLDEHVMQNLFEPFFTTKEPGKGTGLGLAICKDIIERYSGQIIARNQPGPGSVFTVIIPHVGL